MNQAGFVNWADSFNLKGYDYGARGGKTLSVFIEDLNLPEADMYGIQEVNEVQLPIDSVWVVWSR